MLSRGCGTCLLVYGVKWVGHWRRCEKFSRAQVMEVGPQMPCKKRALFGLKLKDKEVSKNK